MLWSKFIDSFRFDDEAACSLIFIDHPAEYYIGMSAITYDLMMLSKKKKSSSEGVAYLLIYHFPEAHIRVLEPEECINVVMNMTNLGEDIPVDLLC